MKLKPTNGDDTNFMQTEKLSRYKKKKQPVNDLIFNNNLRDDSLSNNEPEDTNMEAETPIRPVILNFAQNKHIYNGK